MRKQTNLTGAGLRAWPLFKNRTCSHQFKFRLFSLLCLQSCLSALLPSLYTQSALAPPLFFFLIVVYLLRGTREREICITHLLSAAHFARSFGDQGWLVRGGCFAGGAASSAPHVCRRLTWRAPFCQWQIFSFDQLITLFLIYLVPKVRFAMLEYVREG